MSEKDGQKHRETQDGDVMLVDDPRAAAELAPFTSAECVAEAEACMLTNRSVSLTGGQEEAVAAVREAAVQLIKRILLRVPVCADRSAAVRLVREALWTAEAALCSPRWRSSG